MMPYSMKLAKKKITKFKIKFQKNEGHFLDSIPSLKSHQPPLMYIYIYIYILKEKEFNS